MTTLKNLKNVMKHFRQAFKSKNINLGKTDTECWETDICITASLDCTDKMLKVYTIILFEDHIDVALDDVYTEEILFSQYTDYSDLESLTQQILNLSF